VVEGREDSGREGRVESDVVEEREGSGRVGRGNVTPWKDAGDAAARGAEEARGRRTRGTRPRGARGSEVVEERGGRGREARGGARWWKNAGDAGGRGLEDSPIAHASAVQRVSLASGQARSPTGAPRVSSTTAAKCSAAPTSVQA
jgi:hypothetical protein